LWRIFFCVWLNGENRREPSRMRGMKSEASAKVPDFGGSADEAEGEKDSPAYRQAGVSRTKEIPRPMSGCRIILILK
jgi:hypothetical protein